jgi:DMSO/TMAO reductase YedYZ heme-binding membrane subunit
MTPKLWWYAARASGIVAWALAAASVIWGLLLSTRAARGLAKPAWLLDLHRYLGALTLAAVAVHMSALVADSFVPFGLADLFVPGASAWKTTPVALGVIAFWLFAAVEVSSLARRRLPNKVWARIHLLSFVAYVLATLHYLQAGTERTNPVMLLVVEVASAAVIGLTVLRILTPRRPRRARTPATAARSA